VGLEYLTLSRKAGTLSGGEAQRIRLATQIGSKLTGVLYVLDEPSIGLHQRDNHKLIEALKEMRDLGNTLVVVEHDEEIMRECDYIVDIGPGAGVHGGELVACGEPDYFINHADTLTADYLSGRKKIDIPTEVKANGLPITLCSKCAASIQAAQAKKEEEYQAAPGNYAKGLLGSIGGALIGGFVWIALAVILGFMSAFVAMLISYLAAMGYDKMKGKQNKVKVIINFIVSLVVIVLSTYLSYVFIVGDANTLHHILATDGEVLGGFIGDMLFSIIFGALGIFAYTQSLKKKLHK
jgi:hypothetical protein